MQGEIPNEQYLAELWAVLNLLQLYQGDNKAEKSYADMSLKEQLCVLCLGCTCFEVQA